MVSHLGTFWLSLPGVTSKHEQVEALPDTAERGTETGMAIGMLIERFGLDHHQAFQLLTRCSQRNNRKLYDTAVEFLITRELPSAEFEPEGSAVDQQASDSW